MQYLEDRASRILSRESYSIERNQASKERSRPVVPVASLSLPYDPVLGFRLS